MSTAHRPTWAPAKGHEEQGGSRWFAPVHQFSAKNQAGHLKLKFRQQGQSQASEVAERDLRAELEEKERKHFAKAKGLDFEEEKQRDLLLLTAPPETSVAPGKKPLMPRAADADESEDEGSGSESDDDDDEDDEAALMAELDRIKKERAVEAAKKAAEAAQRDTEEKQAQLITGNPLLQLAGGGEANFNLKRRWDEDVVFKNQSRGEPKTQKRFINDTIRSDFHRRFLNKYVR